MPHPALTQALAAAHVADLHHTAAQRRAIRLARRAAHEPHAVAGPIAIMRSASTRLRRRRAPRAAGRTT